MKNSILSRIFLCFFFLLVFCTSLAAQNINLLWNTFLGSGDWDVGNGIAIDGSGRILVTGYSWASWGAPLNGHSGRSDAFAACLDSDGHLIWNTFLGSGTEDTGDGIALDGSGRILVTGSSYASWGAPVNGHSGGRDAFAACLDSDGHLIWNTFLGSGEYDVGYGIAFDGSGRILVIGISLASWGTPVNGYSGNYDAFAACLDSDGHLIWNTFLGSGSSDGGNGIAIDGSGRILVTGSSSASWGVPVSYYNEGSDIFVAVLFQAFRVSALVSGGNGRVSPAVQDIIPGESAVIHLTPDPGYEIESITDNGVLRPIANPYLINNVQENHEVTVSFTNVAYPPTLNLSARRNTDHSWITSREYGEIAIEITEHPDKPMPVSRYILFRLDGGSSVQYIEPGSYIYIDRFLEPDKSYSYQVVAMTAEGFVAAVSRVVTI